MKKIITTFFLIAFLIAGVAFAGDSENDETVVSPQLISDGTLHDGNSSYDSTSTKNLVGSGAYPMVDGDSADFQDRNWIGTRGTLSNASNIISDAEAAAVRSVSTPKGPKRP